MTQSPQHAACQLSFRTIEGRKYSTSGCAPTSSPTARSDGIDPSPSPRASRWDVCRTGGIRQDPSDWWSYCRLTVGFNRPEHRRGGRRDCISLAHPLNSVNANILRPAIAVLCAQRAHFGAESRLKMGTSRTALRLRGGARACVARSGTARDFRSAAQCGLSSDLARPIPANYPRLTVRHESPSGFSPTVALRSEGEGQQDAQCATRS